MIVLVVLVTLGLAAFIVVALIIYCYIIYFILKFSMFEGNYLDFDNIFDGMVIFEMVLAILVVVVVVLVL